MHMEPVIIRRSEAENNSWWPESGWLCHHWLARLFPACKGAKRGSRVLLTPYRRPGKGRVRLVPSMGANSEKIRGVLCGMPGKSQIRIEGSTAYYFTRRANHGGPIYVSAERIEDA